MSRWQNDAAPSGNLKDKIIFKYFVKLIAEVILSSFFANWFNLNWVVLLFQPLNVFWSKNIWLKNCFVRETSMTQSESYRDFLK